MPTTQEAPYSPQSSGGGPQFHVVQVTMMVNGVPTVISMEVIGLADADGNPLSLVSQEAWQQAVLDELRAIRIGTQENLNYMLRTAPDRGAGGRVDNRGNEDLREVDLLDIAQSIREQDPTTIEVI